MASPESEPGRSWSERGQSLLPATPCPSNPLCLSRLPYRGYLGGVFALQPIHYLRINGFPSTHWGWGREDDDIAAR